MAMAVPPFITEFDTWNEQSQKPGSRCHYTCHRKEDGTLVVSLLDGDAFVGSLWLHNLSLNAFSFYFQFFSLFLFLLLSLYSILFFLNFPPSSYPGLFSFSLSPFLSFLSLWLTSCPFHFSSPSSFSFLHLRWFCGVRDILFSLLWI